MRLQLASWWREQNLHSQPAKLSSNHTKRRDQYLVEISRAWIAISAKLQQLLPNFCFDIYCLTRSVAVILKSLAVCHAGY